VSRPLPAVFAFLVGILMTGAIHSAPPPQGGDEAAVAALDTQYQDAVKRNDAGVMDRILLRSRCPRFREPGPPGHECPGYDSTEKPAEAGSLG